MSRIFNLYERNQLTKHGLSDLILPDTDQTPVEYLTGHVDFAGHDFLVNKNVLIPRIETVEIISLAIKNKFPQVSSPRVGEVSRKAGRRSTNNRAYAVADVGTGSGALGISVSLELLKRNIPHQLYLSDISATALKLAGLNASHLLPPDHQPRLIKSDLFTDFSTQPVILNSFQDLRNKLQFDLVFANLPYIPSSRIPTLDSSVKDYEPLLALDGGPDGTTIINRFLSQLPRFLSPAGIAFLEVDHTHTYKSFPQVFPSRLEGMSRSDRGVLGVGFNTELLPDSFGQNRFLVIQYHQ